MRILILSCNTGEGHNSAGRALREALTARGAECEMLDALRFGAPGTARLIARGHVFVYRRLPRSFGAVYRALERHDPKRGDSAVYRLNCGRTKSERLRRAVLSGGWDAVICVHVFPAETLTALRRRCGRETPVYFVATDYTCSPGVGEADVDLWFTPHPLLSPEFIAAGADAERILPMGIPVRAAFLESGSRAEARTALGLAPERRSVLVMGGSMGAGGIAALVKRLGSHLTPECEQLVLCGRNERLRRRLEALDLPNARIVGYTDAVPRYMDASDLLITKAGGLSTTEALMKRLPLALLDAVPGCETRNRDFLCHLGCAVTAESAGELADAAAALLRDPEQLAQLRQRIGECFSQRAADEIAERVLRESEKIKETELFSQKRLDKHGDRRYN